MNIKLIVAALVAQLFCHVPHGVLHGEVVEGPVLVLDPDVFQHLGIDG